MSSLNKTLGLMGPGYLHPRKEFYCRPPVVDEERSGTGLDPLEGAVISLVDAQDHVVPLAAVYPVVQPLSGDQLF